MSGGKVQNPPWRHHFIPEFYLKRWTRNGELVQYSKPYRDQVKPKTCSPRETGFVNAREILKELPLETKALFEEKFFSPVDNRAALVLAKIERGDRMISGPERVAWAQFMMTLLFRHPSYVDKLRERLHQNMVVITPESERRWEKTRGKNDPTTLAEFIREEVERNPDEISRKSLELAADMMASEKIGSHLCNMIWGSIPLAPTELALLTSDRPIHWFGPLQADDCHILMPVGPKRIFWAVNSSQMSATIRTARHDQLIEFMNNHSVRRALKYVYALGDQHLNYVQERMGVDPEITIADRFMGPVPAAEIMKEKEAVRRRRRRKPGQARQSR